MTQRTQCRKVGMAKLLGVSLVLGVVSGAAASPPLANGASGRAATSRPGDATQANALSQSSRPTATWVGFRRTGPKSAVVYVHLTDKVRFEETKNEKTVTLTLHDTKIEVKNNQNPLLASHFDSAVDSARMFPSGKDVKLQIQLQRQATVNPKMVQEADGAVLYVEFVEP